MFATTGKVKVLGLTSNTYKEKTYHDLNIYHNGAMVKFSVKPEQIPELPKVDSEVRLEFELRNFNGKLSGLEYVGYIPA